MLLWDGHVAREAIRQDDPLLRERLEELARVRCRFGYPRLHAFLRREGHGRSLDSDIIAVRVTPDLRTAVVASPDYLSRFPAPESPRDLQRHRCIGWRQAGSGALYR